jgi:hypothetical protein
MTALSSAIAKVGRNFTNSRNSVPKMPDRADEDADVGQRREEHVPLARQERPVQAGHDDHEPLEPHPDRHEQRDDPDHQRVLPQRGTRTPAG